ncbi:hypothetical protein ACQKOF_02765 [Lysinibacillus sp. NPDC093190]|uniref:hypothetical protein n=1 Tax=Lysinibacillus sp. NPDC093190 TaxID=3390575 RepID=UPI003D012F0E
MDENEKLNKILGVTEFSLYSRDALPDLTSYKFYENYCKEISNQVKEDLIRLKKENLIRNLEFKYIPGFEINGVSFVRNETDYIWIEEGVIIKTYNMFSELLTHNVFPKYFTTQNEVAQISLRYKNEEGINEFNYTYRTSMDEKRKIIAEYLSMFSTKFIILHEIAHHFNGHILYLNKELKIDKLNIYNNNLNTEPILIQTLEMDADAFAISQLTREVVEIINTDARLKEICKSKYEIIGLLIYSLTCLFSMIIRTDNNDYEKISENIYLPSSMRFFNNISCLETNLKIQANELYKEIDFEDVLKKYMLDAQNHYNEIFDKKLDWKSFIINSSINSEHFNKLNYYWKENRLGLEKYARCGLSN